MKKFFKKEFKGFYEFYKDAKASLLKVIESQDFWYDGYMNEPKFPKFDKSGNILTSKTFNFVAVDCGEDLDRVDEILKEVITKTNSNNWYYSPKLDGDDFRLTDALEIFCDFGCEETSGVHLYVKIFDLYSKQPTIVIHMNDNA